MQPSLLDLHDDVLYHIVPFCRNTTLASLATTCKYMQALLAHVGRVWRNITVAAFTQQVFLMPSYIAFKAHGPHILRITLGHKHSANIYWTNVTSHAVNTIARYCHNLQQLFMYTHETTVTCDVTDMIDVFTHCTHLRDVCIPYKLTYVHVDDMSMVKQRVTFDKLTLFGDCFNKMSLRVVVSLFRLMDTRRLRVLKLHHLIDLNLEQVLRHFNNLEKLVIRHCTSKWANVTWDYPLHTLRTLKIRTSKSVVKSMKPIVMSLDTSTSPLPLQHFAADSDDAAFVHFALMMTCGKCSRISNRHFHLLTHMCSTCCKRLPLNLPLLHSFKFYNTYSTRLLGE